MITFDKLQNEFTADDPRHELAEASRKLLKACAKKGYQLLAVAVPENALEKKAAGDESANFFITYITPIDAAYAMTREILKLSEAANVDAVTMADVIKGIVAENVEA